MNPLIIHRDSICWRRGRGVCRFQAGARVFVDKATARTLLSAKRAEIEYHQKGWTMNIIAHAIERITPPANEPVSVSEAKNYLRVEHASDDALITLMITAAREAAESYLGTSFITQRWKMTLENELPAIVPLRFGLVQSIVSIVAKDEEGESATMSEDGYRLAIDKRGVHIFAPRTGYRFEITYDAGYGASASLMPGLIRQGILQHVGAMYEQREMSAPIPTMALQAYHPYKEINL